MMPRNLVLIRHGESEGNVATRLSKEGDDSHFTQGFRDKPGSQWRLTEKGVLEAKKAGEWLKAHNINRFGRYYVSPLKRTRETAAHLGLPDAKWFISAYLREREWGDLQGLTYLEQRANYSRSMLLKQTDGFYWTPPNGESMAMVCLRVDRTFSTLHRECSETSVVMAPHGETMLACKMNIERIDPEGFYAVYKQHPHNCEIWHYTRIDPETSKESKRLDWVRTINPTVSDIPSPWRHIERKGYSNEELMETL